MAGDAGELEFVARLRDEASAEARSARAALDSVGGPTTPITTPIRVDADQALRMLDQLPADARGAVARTGAEFDALPADVRAAMVEAAAEGRVLEDSGAEAGRGFAAELRTELSGVEADVRTELAGAAAAAETQLDEAGTDAGNGLVSGIRSGAAKIGPAIAGALAAAGIGTLLSKALDVEAGVDSLEAQLGTTPPVAARYGRLAGRLYAEAWGSSMDDVVAAIAAVKTSFRDLDGRELEDTTRRALALSDVFGYDVPRAAQVAGQSITQGLAKDGEQAFDLITAASQRVPVAVRDDVLDAADEYGGFFAALGYDGEQAFSTLVRGARRGMYGIDKAGDAVKEFTILSTDLSASSREAYAAIGLDAEDMANRILAGGGTARKATNQIIDGLLGIEDPADRANAAIKLFGTPIEDLGVNQIPDFLRSLQAGKSELGDFEGAADRAANSVGSNARSELTAFGRGIETWVVEKLADSLPELRAFAGELKTTFGPSMEQRVNTLRSLGGAFADLPDPVKTFTGAAALAALALPRIAGAGATVVGSLSAMRAGAATTRTGFARLQGGAGLLAGAAGLGLLTAASQESSTELRTLEKIAGGALLGFAVGGPIGGAIGGAAGGMQELATNTSVTAETARQIAGGFNEANGVLKLFAYLSGDSADQTRDAADAAREADGAVGDYAATLDQVTGAISRQTRETVLSKLEQEDLIGVGKSLGLDTRDLIGATLGNADAQRKVNRAYRNNADLLNGFDFAKINEFIREQGGAFRADQAAIRERNAALTTYAGVVKGMPKEVRTRLENLNYDPTRRQLQNLIDSSDKLTEKEKRILIREFGADGATRKVKGLNRELGQTGKAKPDLGPWGLLLRRGVDTAQRGVEKGRRGIDRDLRSTGRVQPSTQPWERGLDRSLQRGRRNAQRETSGLSRDLSRGTSRATPFLDFYQRNLGTSMGNARRVGSRGTKGLSDELSRGTARVTPNLKNYAASLVRDIQQSRSRAQSGSKGIGDALKRGPEGARVNMGGYNSSIQGPIPGIRGGAYSGGVGVGNALEDGVVAGFAGTASRLAAQAASAVSQAIAAARARADARSPSREMAKVGHDLADGLAVGMSERKNNVRKATNRIIGGVLISAILGGKDEVDKGVARINDAIKKLVNSRISNDKKAAARVRTVLKNLSDETRAVQRKAAELDAVNKKIAAARAYAADLERRTLENTRVTSIESVNEAPITAGFISEGLKDELAKIEDYRADLAKLRRDGILSKDQIKALEQAGYEEGGAYADALANATPAQLREINKTNKAIADEAKRLGQESTKGLLDGLFKDRQAITKAAERLARELQRAIRKALKIKSPSRVTAEDGRYVTLGLARGIRDAGPAAEVEAARMAARVAAAARPTFDELASMSQAQVRIRPVAPIQQVITIRHEVTSPDGSVSDLDAEKIADLLGRDQRVPRRLEKALSQVRVRVGKNRLTATGG